MNISPDKLVTMHNQLVKAAHGLSLNEKRLLMLAVSKLDSRSSVSEMYVKITVAEFIAEYKVDPDAAYRITKDAINGLHERYITFVGGFKNGASVDKVDWLQHSGYQDAEAWVHLTINNELAPFLTALKEHFTSYKLSDANKLRSVYSWRLFELLMQFKKTGMLTVNIDDLIKSLEIPNSISCNFALIKLRVIEPALHEINEKCGVTAEYEPIKTGRKVTSLSFTFTLAIDPPLPIAMVSPEPKPLTMKQAKQIRTQQQRLNAIEAQSRAQFEKLAAEYGYNLNDYAHKSNQ